jgi:hypothetical protein
MARTRERIQILAHSTVQQSRLEERNRTSRNGKEETRREMRENMSICKGLGMAAERE